MYPCKCVYPNIYIQSSHNPLIGNMLETIKMGDYNLKKSFQSRIAMHIRIVSICICVCMYSMYILAIIIVGECTCIVSAYEVRHVVYVVFVDLLIKGLYQHIGRQAYIAINRYSTGLRLVLSFRYQQHAELQLNKYKQIAGREVRIIMHTIQAVTTTLCLGLYTI